MKILRTTLLLALISIMSFGCTTHPTPSVYGSEAYKRQLNGNVKTLEESRFSILKEYDEQNTFLNFNSIVIFTYNQNKDIVKYEYYYNTGELKRTLTYIYDELDNEIECVSENYDPPRSSITKSIYDDNNKKVEQHRYKIENDTIFAGRSTLEYDQNNNLIKNTHYTDSVIDMIELYKYDDQYRIIEDVVNFGDSSSILRKTQYKYYDNKMDLTQFASEGELRTVTFTYDSSGNIIEAYWNHVNDIYPNFTYKSKYDKYDNSIEYTKYDDAGEITETKTHTYRYDKHDNWIEKIDYENKIPKYITTREITYY